MVRYLYVQVGKVEIAETGYVACHVFAFADELNIYGKAYDIYSASQTLNVYESARIYRDIKSIADDMYLSGTIERDTYLQAENIEIDKEPSNLHIQGKLFYETNREIENIKEANILGEVSFKELSKTEKVGESLGDYVLSAISTIIFDVILYLLVLFFTPKFVKKAKEYVSVRGLLGLAIGLGFTVLVPMLILILFITTVGVRTRFLKLIHIYGSVNDKCFCSLCYC